MLRILRYNRRSEPRPYGTPRVGNCAPISVAACCIMLAAVAVSQPGTGQPGGDGGQGAVAPATSGGDEIKEIIVTATKRPENLQRVPIAVTVLFGDDLEARHAYDPMQLPNLVSNLQVQGNSSALGATNVFIRGIGTAAFGVALEPSVATVVDDIVMGRPEMGVVQFYDIDQMEVLRGPQGTLFGINASAGVVSISTVEPAIGRTESRGEVAYGHQDDATAGNEVLAHGTLNLPVSADSAVRISAFRDSNVGVVKNIYQAGENLGFIETGARVKYLWRPNASWEVLLAADYAQEYGAYDSFYTRRFDAPGGFIQAQDSMAGIVASPANLNIASNAPTFGRFHLGGVQAKVNYRFGDGWTATNIAGVRGYNNHTGIDGDQLPIQFFDVVLPNIYDTQVTDELRVTSPAGGPLEYQIGAFYMNLRSAGTAILCANLEPLLPPPPPGQCSSGENNDERVRRRNVAAFGQVTYSLAAPLRLIAGGRLTSDHFYDHFVAILGNDLQSLEKLGSPTVRLSNTNFSYRAGVQYDAAPGIMSYVTYARGYKGPAFDLSSFATVHPEISTDVELGLKAELWDRRLVMNLDVYRENFYGYQAQGYVISGNTAFFELTNVGTLRAQGIEADFKSIPVSGLSLDGSVAFNEAVFENYLGAPCYFSEPQGSSGTNVCLPNGTTNVDGNPLNLAPRWSGVLAATYDHSISMSIRAFIGMDYSYHSWMHFDATRDPQQRLGGLGMLGARIGVASENSRWRVSVFVRNVFNKSFPIQIRPDALAGVSGDATRGGDYWQAFDPSAFRTVGISVAYGK